MKKTITAALVLVIAITMFSSCNRYAGESYGGSCGVWYPKKCKIGTKNW